MTSEGRPTRILRALDRSPDGLSTLQLAAELAEGIDRSRFLSWYGEILRRYREAGRVEEIGRTKGGYQQCPSVIWRITDEGRKLLACIDDAPRLEAERARANAELAEAAQRRAEALAEGARLYSRQTPRGERWNATVRLRQLGCTLEEIGQLFGVTREMIRKELLLTEEPLPRRPGRPAVKVSRQVRAPAPGVPSLSLSARQEEFLLDLIGHRRMPNYSHFITTARALEARGLLDRGSGLRLTGEGRRVAELLLAAASPATDKETA